MLFWKRFPFIRITGSFCLGILTGNYLELPLKFLISTTSTVILIYLLSTIIFVRKKFRKFNILISIIALTVFFLSGFLMIRLKNLESKRIIQLILNTPVEHYLARVVQLTGKTEKNQKLLAELCIVRSGEKVIRVPGKILIYLPADRSIDYGDLIMVPDKPRPFEDPAFPYEFNYKGYMIRRGILFHQFLTHSAYTIIEQETPANLQGFSLELRETLITRVHERIGDARVQALMIALTTGKRDYFDEETYEEFLGAGIVHILAVSGLHVGIVYYLLLLITRPLSLNRAGRWIRLSLILPVFMLVALLTGLSPSVLRSVVMFSIVLMGSTLNRKTSILNSVFLSAFLLLCYDPGFLWQVGFQLSYAAVLGIILFQPLLQSFWTLKHWLSQWIWNLVTVSLSAQVATLPLTLLYFKQFPSYFLISNLFAIPFTTVFIPGSILFNFTYPLKHLNHWICTFLEYAALLFFNMIRTINDLPGSLVYPVNISMTDSLLIFCLICLLYAVLKYRKYRLSGFMVAILLLIILKDAAVYFNPSGNKKILLYAIRGTPVIELVDGHQSFL
ncbi:MAG: ComEC family competence protein, partial [Cyclobacteriaceae bacterium]|nr:ComEC family competence protein [Cyclobacteriaceae bacterium]